MFREKALFLFCAGCEVEDFHKSSTPTGIHHWIFIHRSCKKLHLTNTITYLMHIHYVAQVGLSALALGLCWTGKVITHAQGVSVSGGRLERDPYSFCPFVVVRHLRTPEFLFFLPTPCFTVSQWMHVLGW